MKKMIETNVALIAKLGWRVVSSPESLWVQLLKLKYQVQHPTSILVGNERASGVWKGISWVMPQLLVGVCLLLRCGDVVQIREDPWLPNGPNFYPI